VALHIYLKNDLFLLFSSWAHFYIPFVELRYSFHASSAGWFFSARLGLTEFEGPFCLLHLRICVLIITRGSLFYFVVLPSSTYLFTVGVEGFDFSLHHTQTHTTVGRTPLDEGSARRRDLYLTTQTLYKRQTSMSPVGFEPTILASARPQTYALDRADKDGK
jgi:hypothetical protein